MVVQILGQLSKHKLETHCYFVGFILLIKKKLIVNMRLSPLLQLREPAPLSLQEAGKVKTVRKA